MAGVLHWVDLPPEVKEITRRIAAGGLSESELEALRAERHALVSELRCEFGLSPLARLSTAEQMEQLGMLAGSGTPPYPPLSWEDGTTDRHDYLKAHDLPAAGGIGRWKLRAINGGLVFPEEIAAALAAVPPEAHKRAAQRVAWWPGFMAFLAAAQAHGGAIF